jgi:hypothetical protein
MELGRKEGWRPSSKDGLKPKGVFGLAKMGKAIAQFSAHNALSAQPRPIFEATVPVKDGVVSLEDANPHRQGIKEWAGKSKMHAIYPTRH